MQDAPDNLGKLLACLIHNNPNFLNRQSKGAMKREFIQHLLPASPWARATRDEFFRSEWVAEVAKTPAKWPEVRDLVEREALFRIKSSLKGTCVGLAIVGAAFLWIPGANQLHFHYSWLLWPFIASLHFLVDWRWVRRWDRMWESSAAARALCPDHPAFHPPHRARKLIAFTHSPEVCFDVLGDLDEGFEKLSAEFGFRYARTWYAWNVLKSLSPSLDALVERLTKWGIGAGALEFLRHLLAHKN